MLLRHAIYAVVVIGVAAVDVDGVVSFNVMNYGADLRLRVKIPQLNSALTLQQRGASEDAAVDGGRTTEARA